MTIHESKPAKTLPFSIIESSENRMNSIVIHPSDTEVKQEFITPEQLKTELPISAKSAATIESSRETIKNILDKKDHRLLVIVGPCSIHDVDAALDYASKLKVLADELSDSLYIVMRVYFEKPRTSVVGKD